jgi:hypothetical protein
VDSPRCCGELQQITQPGQRRPGRSRVRPAIHCRCFRPARWRSIWPTSTLGKVTHGCSPARSLGMDFVRPDPAERKVIWPPLTQQPDRPARSPNHPLVLRSQADHGRDCQRQGSPDAGPGQPVTVPYRSPAAAPSCNAHPNRRRNGCTARVTWHPAAKTLRGPTSRVGLLPGQINPGWRS